MRLSKNVHKKLRLYLFKGGRHRSFQEKRSFAFGDVFLSLYGDHNTIFIIGRFNQVNDIVIDNICMVDLGMNIFCVRRLTFLVGRKGVFKFPVIWVLVVVAHNNFTTINEVLYLVPQLDAASNFMTFSLVVIIVCRFIPPRGLRLRIIWTWIIQWSEYLIFQESLENHIKRFSERGVFILGPRCQRFRPRVTRGLLYFCHQKKGSLNTYLASIQFLYSCSYRF